MKKLKLKTFVKVFAFITALSAFFFVACSKDDNVSNDSSELNAIKEPTPKEQAESLIKTNYRYLKYYFGQKKPEDYVNESIRKEVMDKIKEADIQYGNMPLEDMIQDMEKRKSISSAAATSANELNSTLKTFDNLSSYTEMATMLKNYEAKVYGNHQLSEGEKILLAASSGTIREVMRYMDDQDKINGRNQSLNTRSSGCLWGRQTSCFGSALLKAGLKAGEKFLETGSIKKALVGFLVGTISGIIDVFKSSTCKCGETNTCYDPMGVNPIVSSTSTCNPAIAFGLWGSGTVPQQFRWWAYRTDANGFEYPIQDVQDKRTGEPVLPPFVVPNPNENIRLYVETLCNGSSAVATETFHFKISNLLGDPGSVIITGQADALFLETVTYSLNGECVLNPNNQLQWGIPSQATLLSGGGSGGSATVRWNTRTCSGSGGSSGWSGCFRPTLSASSFNPCTNTTSNGWLSVAVR